MGVGLDDKEASRYIMDFLKQRPATKEELDSLLDQIEEMKINHHLYELLSRGQIIAGLEDGELAFTPVGS